MTRSKAIYPQGAIKSEESLEGVAPKTVNAEVYYETPQWAIRSNYNWTSAILQQTALTTLPARYSAPFGLLSLHASYKLKPNLVVFAEATNVLDMAEKDYVLNGYFANYTYYGRTFSLGVRMML